MTELTIATIPVIVASLDETVKTLVKTYPSIYLLYHLYLDFYLRLQDTIFQMYTWEIIS